MRIVWLTPAAFVGLLVLAIPIAIHLLTRHQTRHVLFPTLRFLRATRPAALRRHAIHDWPLLVVRLLMLSAAVAALSAPVVISPARERAWGQRVARALVVVMANQAGRAELDGIIAGEQRASFASQVFIVSTTVADAIRDAALWLNGGPPAAREMVFVGDLREGAISSADLAMLPSAAGIRFLPLPGSPVAAPIERHAVHGVAAPVEWRMNVLPEVARTRVAYARVREVMSPIDVRAAAAEQAAVRAALAALLARGLPIDARDGRRVVIAFEGAPEADLGTAAPPTQPWMRAALGRLPGATGGERAGALVVRLPRAPTAAAAASALDLVARAVWPPEEGMVEPNRLSPQQLARWSRPPGSVDTTRPGDEGDRRWFWAAVLALMIAEPFVRRRVSRRNDEPAVQEARVA